MNASEDGFSLVEALIALAVIAGMTGALMATVAQDARARHAIAARRTALALARSALDRAGAGAGAGDGAGDGADSGRWQALSWHIDRQPYGASDPLGSMPLEQLTVTVTDPDRQRLVTLTTVQIKP